LKENKFQDNILIRAMALASINGKKEIAKTFFAVDPGFGQKALRYAAIAATYDKKEPLEAILKYTDITDLNFNLPSQDGSTPLWLLMLAFSQDKKQGLNYILDIKENKDIDLNFEINVEGYPNYKKLAQMINAQGETRVLDSIIKKNAELNKSSGENIVDSSVRTTKFKR
jgi:V8-like Glu-specific endopeptidase